MRSRLLILLTLLSVIVMLGHSAHSIVFIDLNIDPLVRMPGTQPDQNVNLDEPVFCLSCHGERPTDPTGNIVAPGFSWSGSMMAQSARDPIFWACLVTALQDSIWATGALTEPKDPNTGNPNAGDICLRCHFPEGWLGNRSGHADPQNLNASAMTGSDFDGVGCDLCHRAYDPFFETAFTGARESTDWITYWDEFNNTGPSSGTDSQVAAEVTLAEDRLLSEDILLFNGNNFFQDYVPFSDTYNENASGQYFVSTVNGFSQSNPRNGRRAGFADTVPDHTVFYSRYHKSKFFCSTCHDVSNPILANLEFLGTPPGDGVTVLTTEKDSAYSYFHVERTFSEFMLSAYAQEGGAPTNPDFQAQGASDITHAVKCQDCHMQDVLGKGCEEVAAPLRPTQSTEHPNSGAPFHNFQGGNIWVPYVIGSTDSHFTSFDQVNFDLLMQGPQTLTLDMSMGVPPLDNGDALIAASERAKQQLRLAGTIKNVSYDPATGDLFFRIQNNTGHKLITGFLEGRRMFLNIKAYANGNLIHEVNPYDFTVGSLKGQDLKVAPNSPPLGPNEVYDDTLVFETKPKSDLTGEEKTFHFALATARFKDNRIPPKGFNRDDAPTRISEPVINGVPDLNWFTQAEYDGGYDDRGMTIKNGADHIVLTLYYQSTSREYIEFLRDEINGTSNTLNVATPLYDNAPPPSSPYIVQTDPFFASLKAWGDTIWQLWWHNHGLDGSGALVPGIVPFEMSQATWTYIEPCEGDFDGDGDVDGSDLAIFSADFGRTDCITDCEGDFDEDGDVDGSDLDVFSGDFGRTNCP